MKTVIIVPTYNERENLQPLIEAAFARTPDDVHLLIVDDNSPDGTGKIAEALTSTRPRLHVLHRAAKQGLGKAYTAGFHWAFENGFEQLIQMDCDFSHNPDYLPKMLELMKAHEVVIGSRYVPGGGTINWGIARKIISRGGSLYARTILGAPIRDFTGGFIGWHCQTLKDIGVDSLKSDGYSFQIELKYRAFRRGSRIIEFPIVFEDRKVGTSKMSKKIIFEALKRVWQFRFGASTSPLLDHGTKTP